jgi:hypothetical protein
VPLQLIDKPGDSEMTGNGYPGVFRSRLSAECLDGICVAVRSFKMANAPGSAAHDRHSHFDQHPKSMNWLLSRY